jgi:hypothetical protein
MSQSGYTPIQLYRTTTAAATPSAGNLAAGELAINLTDEKLYFKNAGGTVKLLASTDTLGTVTSVDVSGGTTGLTTSGGPITTSGTITLAGTLGVANGGTGTTTAFTAGSIVFAGASGVYTQDNANLFWDNANDRLGVGTATPAYRLDVNGAINVAAGQYIRSGSAFLLASNGTSLNYIYSGSGALVWRNGADTAELMRLENGGNLLVGTTTARNRLTVQGNVFSTPTLGTASGQAFFGEAAGYGMMLGTSGFGYGWIQQQRVDGTATAYDLLLQPVGGNVGIGVTNPSPYAGYVTLAVGGSAGGSLDFVSSAVGVNYNRVGQISAVTGGTMVFATGAGDALAERMRIDGSGNLLVGTTTAIGRLTVVGNSTEMFTLTGASTTSGYGQFKNSSGTTYAILGNGGGGALSGGAATDFAIRAEANMLFAIGNAEQFRITSTGGITSANLADAVGYKGLPQNSQTSSYTLALSDMGKHISITTGGVVIPANGSVAFPIGATIVVFNNSASTQTISITTDTLRQAGTTNTGTRTLAVYGLATLVKVTSTVWVVTGNIS